MSFADVGALGELFGAIGVVISILYLSRQIRQNTDAVRNGNATTVQENFQQLARVPYRPRDGVPYPKAMAGDDLEDPADRQAAYSFFFDMLKTVEVSHLKYLNGELDEGPPLSGHSFREVCGRSVHRSGLLS